MWNHWIQDLILQEMSFFNTANPYRKINNIFQRLRKLKESKASSKTILRKDNPNKNWSYVSLMNDWTMWRLAFTDWFDKFRVLLKAKNKRKKRVENNSSEKTKIWKLWQFALQRIFKEQFSIRWWKLVFCFGASSVVCRWAGGNIYLLDRV